ncbi:MAG: hypothetical protein N3A66_00840 [Planctomycetota bacterium]|nr:hypothetical protein [Planctomycetota bacterium]
MWRKSAVFFWAFAFVLAAAAVNAGERREVEDRDEANRPKIWQEAKGQEILMAQQVARAEAMRKLLERIYGLEVYGDTSVYDLVKADKEVEARLSGVLKGMREKRWHFYEDGSCQVEMVVTWREIVEKVETTVNETFKGDKVIKRDEFIKINVENRDRDIVMWGSGALPNTPGVAVVQAQRAAEVDAYERLAARVVGVQIDAQTTVKDMVLESDEINACVAAALRGVEFTDYRIKPKWVEADATINIAMVIQRVERTYNQVVERKKWRRDRINEQAFEKVTERLKTEEFRETGRGALDAQDDIKPVRTPEPAEGFSFERTIIKRVVAGGTTPKNDE